jgi:hypothetical protein
MDPPLREALDVLSLKSAQTGGAHGTTMATKKDFKYRLYPTDDQTSALTEVFGHTLHV